jgi:hypothetical protein
MPLTLPSRYNNAPIRHADMTRPMLDLYEIVAQINTGVSPKAVQVVTPLTGAIVQMSNDNTDGTIWINPATNIAALTLTFPADANSDLGQVRRIAASKVVTTLTLTGATILNSTVTMNANDCVTYQKIAANTWVLCT